MFVIRNYIMCVFASVFTINKNTMYVRANAKSRALYPSPRALGIFLGLHIAATEAGSIMYVA